jgi:hypothetical protein
VKRLTALVALFPALAFAGSNNSDFSVQPSFVASKKPSSVATVSILFKASNPDVRINEEPAPRLKLDPEQKVLIYKAPEGVMAPPNFDPAFARYLDLNKPISFSVTRAPGAPKGRQTVSGSVVYFYCSKKEGWCKKGSTSFEVDVRSE